MHSDWRGKFGRSTKENDCYLQPIVSPSVYPSCPIFSLLPSWSWANIYSKLRSLVFLELSSSSKSFHAISQSGCAANSIAVLNKKDVLNFRFCSNIRRNRCPFFNGPWKLRSLNLVFRARLNYFRPELKLFNSILTSSLPSNHIDILTE